MLSQLNVSYSPEKESAYDQRTYVGRILHFLRYTNPMYSFPSSALFFSSSSLGMLFTLPLKWNITNNSLLTSKDSALDLMFLIKNSGMLNMVREIGFNIIWTSSISSYGQYSSWNWQRNPSCLQNVFFCPCQYSYCHWSCSYCSYCNISLLLNSFLNNFSL